MLNKEKQYLHALMCVKGMSVINLHKAMQMLDSAEKIWHASPTLLSKCGIKKETAYKICEHKKNADIKHVQKELNNVQKQYQMQLLTKNDAEYPEQLKNIPQPPELLYCRGDKSILNSRPLLAVVGARKASSYGRQIVEDTIPPLVQGGAVIVSGLAYGIDAAAHQETLNATGSTIGVLGSSVLPHQIYPATNRALAKHIIQQGGLLISEYPPNFPTYPANFPERNRIIAGLSQATIVIEASKKSGALITAHHAVEYGREVFAAPGSIYSTLSDGTNYLIERGATPWLSCASINNGLEYLMKKRIVMISPEEEKLLTLITNDKAKINDIIDYHSRPTHEVLALITSLLMKGAIKEIGNQTYACCKQITIRNTK